MTATPEPQRNPQRLAAPPIGRLVLLFGAYAPVALIVAARVFPHAVFWVSGAIGLLGTIAWVVFLWGLPSRQPRMAQVEDCELIDSEVTGYVVSLLLPLVAASSPSSGDLVAYGLCAAMILFVAYVTDLAAVNPFIYAFGFRAARAKVDGVPRTVLVRDIRASDGRVTVATSMGVVLILGS